jgi:hypothetical protein
VNIIDDAAVYLFCSLARGRCYGLCAERVVEPRLLVLESLLSLVKLVEARLLPLAVILVLRGSSLAEASGEVGSPSVELSSELVEWIASGCCWRTKHSHLGSWVVDASLPGGALSASS